MRILFDVLGSPDKSGGMRLYAESLIRAWAAANPHDEIHVVGESWIQDAFHDCGNVSSIVYPPKGTVLRIFGQVIRAGLLFRRTGYDAAISVSPVISPLVPKSKRYVVVHDWRHLKNPAEFGRFQLLYRRLWKFSVARAAGVFVISSKTAKETSALVPAAKTCLAENGADHVMSWRKISRCSDTPRHVVTFGHHSNKRPELLISALAVTMHKETSDLHLTVLGAKGEYKEQLVRLARDLGVHNRLNFPGYVTQVEYERIIQTASLVALVSTDEGFGLPVTEAAYFGIPCIVTTDSGLSEVHGERVHAVAPTSVALAEGMRLLLDASPREPQRLPVNSWGMTAGIARSRVLSNHLKESLSS